MEEAEDFNTHDGRKKAYQTMVFKYLFDRITLGSHVGPIYLYPVTAFGKQLLPILREEIDLLIAGRKACSLSLEDQYDVLHAFYRACFCPLHRPLKGYETLEDISTSECEVCAPKARSFIDNVQSQFSDFFPETIGAT